MTEPVVDHHGREGGRSRRRRGAAVSFNSLLAGVDGFGQLEGGAAVVLDGNEAAALQKRP